MAYTYNCTFQILMTFVDVKINSGELTYYIYRILAAFVCVALFFILILCCLLMVK